MTATTDRIALDRARLAELEVEFAANPNGLYVRENLASLRRRVARYGAVSKSVESFETTVPAASAPTNAPMPIRALSGSREEQLKTISAAFHVDDATLAEALASDITPDAFALSLVEGNTIDAVAKRIAGA